MSDPMTNTEVEDVLASIRRLVSDDTRPEAEEKKEAASDRLVLTPALRVMEDTDAPSDDEAVEIPDKQDNGNMPSRTDPYEVADDDTGYLEPEEDLDASDEIPGDAFIEPAQSEDADGYDASGISEDDEHPITLDTVDLDQDTLMSIQDAFDDAGQDDVDTPSVEPEPHSDMATSAEADQSQGATLSAKIAALETLIAGQTEEFEPEMAGDGENAGTEPPTLEWEDAEIEAEDVAPKMEQATPEEAEPDDAQIFSSDEDVLDEETLRELVSDIVREELQGALGERITRNVRKLVRREIHRALAAQDLE